MDDILTGIERFNAVGTCRNVYLNSLILFCSVS